MRSVCHGVAERFSTVTLDDAISNWLVLLAVSRMGADHTTLASFSIMPIHTHVIPTTHVFNQYGYSQYFVTHIIVWLLKK